MKFYIITAGCTHNFSDSEKMAGVLIRDGHQKSSLQEADIIIFNTCTVKNPTEKNFFNQLEKIEKTYPNKKVIIAGCIPQADPDKFKNYSVLGPKQIHNITKLVNDTINTHLLNNKKLPPLNLPSFRKNPIIEILPINQGCLGACTFCKTKFARGVLQSYSINDIVNQAKRAINDGVKEIWLTSQDTGCYGFDIKTNLPTLLKELIKIDGDFKIRIGMMNPDHMQKIQDELIKVYKSDKIFKFLHLPLQSGSNKVLKDMNRRYTVEDFENIINKFRTKIPGLNIMTDIIVGYPTETNQDFIKTNQAILSICPDSVNISRFWPRPNTPAANLKQLPGNIVKSRSRRLTNIFHKITKERNEHWINWSGEVMIDEKTHNQSIARNFAYKKVLINGNYKIGDKLKVKIINGEKFHLVGLIISS